MSNPEEEIVSAFLYKVSRTYNKPIDELTKVWEIIKSGKKPVVTKSVQVCDHKLTSGKNKGQPCGKKLKDGVCSIHRPKPSTEESKVSTEEPIVEKEEPIVEEEESKVIEKPMKKKKAVSAKTKE